LAGGLLFLFVTVSVGPFILVRPYVRALERRPIGTEQKIRRIILVYAGSLFLLIVPISAFLTLAASGLPERWLEGENAFVALAIGAAIGGAALLLGMAMTSLAIRPSYLRIHPGGGARFGVRGTVAWVSAGLLVVLAPFIVIALLLRAPLVEWPPLVLVPPFVGLSLWLLMAPVIRSHHPRSRPADPALADRLSQRCEQLRMPVKGVSVLELLPKRVVKVSLLRSPLGNHLSISDYVVAQFEPDEIEALLARNIAYRRAHVSLILFVPPALLTLAAVMAVFFAGVTEPFWLGAIALVLIVPLVTWSWARGLRPWSQKLDRRIDDSVMGTVGLDAATTSLEKFLRAAELEPRANPAWKPDLVERIDRLRKRADS
jgi:hypothetical protein